MRVHIGIPWDFLHYKYFIYKLKKGYHGKKAQKRIKQNKHIQREKQTLSLV